MSLQPASTLTLLLVLLVCVPWTSALTLSFVEQLTFGNRLKEIQDKVQSDLVARNVFSLNKNNGDKDVERHTLVDLVLIFPGAGGPDQFTSELQDNISKGRTSKTQNEHCIQVIDWREHRGSFVTAAYDSEAVGEACANSLLQYYEGDIGKIRSIHSIGISVGSFAGNQFAQVCKRRFPKLYVRLTLLDPFCSRGITGIKYGATNFGLNVDFAEHYLNTDDPVPTTNDPLPNCIVYDITSNENRKSFNLPKGETMHCWPVAYYSKYGAHSQLFDDNGFKYVLLPTHSVANSTERGDIIFA